VEPMALEADGVELISLAVYKVLVYDKIVFVRMF
jgi:hypothetical protein